MEIVSSHATASRREVTCKVAFYGLNKIWLARPLRSLYRTLPEGDNLFFDGKLIACRRGRVSRRPSFRYFLNCIGYERTSKPD